MKKVLIFCSLIISFNIFFMPTYAADEDGWIYVGRQDIWEYARFEADTTGRLYKALRSQYYTGTDQTKKDPYIILDEGLHYSFTYEGVKFWSDYDDSIYQKGISYTQEAKLLKSFDLSKYDIKLKRPDYKPVLTAWDPCSMLFINGEQVINMGYYEDGGYSVPYTPGMGYSFRPYYHMPEEGVIIKAGDSFELMVGHLGGYYHTNYKITVDIYIRESEDGSLNLNESQTENGDNFINISTNLKGDIKNGIITAVAKNFKGAWTNMRYEDLYHSFISAVTFYYNAVAPAPQYPTIKSAGHIISTDINMMDINNPSKTTYLNTNNILKNQGYFNSSFNNLVTNETYYVRPYCIISEPYIDTNGIYSEDSPSHIRFPDLYQREFVLYGDIEEIRLKKYVFEKLNEKVNENILPDYSFDERFVIGGSTSIIEDWDVKDQTTSAEYNTSLSNRNINPLFVSNSVNAPSVKSLHTNNFTTPAGHSNFINTNTSYNTKIVDYIRAALKEKAALNTNIFTAYNSTDSRKGDKISYSYLFNDFEKDYKGITISEKLAALVTNLQDNGDSGYVGKFKIRYTHDPNVFDNPVTRSNKHSNTFKEINSLDDSNMIKEVDPSLRGSWILEIQASDDTKNINFNKYSNIASINFTVHEAPVAEIQYVEEGGNYLLTSEFSYDKDYQYTLPEQGITKVKWEYRLEGSSNFINYSSNIRVSLPKVISGKNVAEIALTVWDSQGSSTTTKDMVEITEGKLFAKLSTVKADFSLGSIPVSESLKVTDIKTLPKTPDNLIFRFKNAVPLWNGTTWANGNPQIINRGRSVNVWKHDILTYFWNNINNYTIDPKIKDGTYPVTLFGTPLPTWSDYSLEWNITIKTPINLVISEKPAILQTNELSKIKATTSKYVEKIELYVGNILNQETNKVPESNMNITSTTSGDNKNWGIDFIPPGLPDGNYYLTVKAITTNGMSEKYSYPIILQSVSLSDFRITDIVNHPEEEFGISYPLQKTMGELPFTKYKTGYYATFRINSVGDPGSVVGEIKINGIYKGDINFTKISNDGSNQVWEGRYYSDADLTSGNITLEDITATKGLATYNYNSKESWNGHILTIDGTAYQDGRINRTN